MRSSAILGAGGIKARGESPGGGPNQRQRPPTHSDAEAVWASMGPSLPNHCRSHHPPTHPTHHRHPYSKQGQWPPTTHRDAEAVGVHVVVVVLQGCCRNLVGQVHPAHAAGLVAPAPHHITHRVAAAPHHQHGDVEAREELYAVGVALQGG